MVEIDHEDCDKHIRIIGYVVPPSRFLMYPNQYGMAYFCTRCGAVMLAPRLSTDDGLNGNEE